MVTIENFANIGQEKTKILQILVAKFREISKYWIRAIVKLISTEIERMRVL